MDAEEMDGFFAALICGPVTIPPSVYLGDIWGSEETPFSTAGDFEEFLNLAMRHWNFMARVLSSRDLTFLPWLLVEEGEEIPRGIAGLKAFCGESACAAKRGRRSLRTRTSLLSCCPCWLSRTRMIPTWRCVRGRPRRTASCASSCLRAYLWQRKSSMTTFDPAVCGRRGPNRPVLALQGERSDAMIPALAAQGRSTNAAAVVSPSTETSNGRRQRLAFCGLVGLHGIILVCHCRGQNSARRAKSR